MDKWRELRERISAAHGTAVKDFDRCAADTYCTVLSLMDYLEEEDRMEGLFSTQMAAQLFHEMLESELDD